LLDISIDTVDGAKILAYLDGPDARLFKALIEKLGSEEKVQSAVILMGLLDKLEDVESAGSAETAETTKKLFLEYSGVTYEDFLEMIQNSSSMA